MNPFTVLIASLARPATGRAQPCSLPAAVLRPARKNRFAIAPVKRHLARMLSALIAFFAMAGLSPALATTISSVQINGNQIEIGFDDLVRNASALMLASPTRIALDVNGAQPGASGTPSGPVARVRQARFDEQTTRIVFDLDRPVVIAGGRFGADGKSLILSLREAGEEEFAAQARKGRTLFAPPPGLAAPAAPAAAMAAKPPRSKYSVSVPIGSPRSIPLPRIYGPSNPRLPLVVVDAGHGGHDPGAISPQLGTREKDVTLAIAKAIRDELVATGRVRVALTREDDRFLVLEERYGVARRLKADLFISIHADAAASPDATGATIYTLSEVASDREAARLAARENKANIINGVDLSKHSGEVSNILLDLTQRETMNLSAEFARLLQREARDDFRFRSTSHRFAGFVVLKAPDTPSILLETGYISNPNDARTLASREGQRKIAVGIRQAVQIHFARQMAGG